MKNITRRNALQDMIVATTGAVLLGTGVAVQTACGPNLQTQFAIARQILGAVSNTVDQLHLPGLVALIAKVTAAINDVEKAYKAEKFVDALTFLNEIGRPDGLFDQILNDVNVKSNKTIKGFMLALQGALSVIAIILESQKGQPGIAAVIGDESDPRIQTVKRLASEDRIDAALKTLRQ